MSETWHLLFVKRFDSPLTPESILDGGSTSPEVMQRGQAVEPRRTSPPRPHICPNRRSRTQSEWQLQPADISNRHGFNHTALNGDLPAQSVELGRLLRSERLSQYSIPTLAYLF